MRSKAYEVALALIQSAETAKAVSKNFAKGITVNINPEVTTRPSADTKIIDLTNEAVANAYDIMSSNIRGKLTELTIRSPVTDFGIKIRKDGVVELHKTYAQLVDVSPSLKTITAMQEDTTYIIHVENINWIRSFLATVEVSAPITFPNIFAAYEEYP